MNKAFINQFCNTVQHLVGRSGHESINTKTELLSNPTPLKTDEVYKLANSLLNSNVKQHLRTDTMWLNKPFYHKIYSNELFFITYFASETVLSECSISIPLDSS